MQPKKKRQPKSSEFMMSVAMLKIPLAVASRVYHSYAAKTGDKTPTVIASTASPYKFPRVAVSAITGKDSGNDFKATKHCTNFLV